jgi:hypothetical protein
VLGGERGGSLQGDVGGELGGMPGGEVGGELDGAIGTTSGGHSLAGGSLPQPSLTGDATPGQGTNAGAGGTGGGDRPGQGAGSGARAPGQATSAGAGTAGSRAGGDGGRPNGAQSSEGPSGDGGPRTTTDRIARIAGYANFEFGRHGSPGGGSGGVPGGHGRHSGVGWQILYTAIAVFSILTLFTGGGGLAALFRSIGSGLKRLAAAIAALFTRKLWSRLATWWANRPIGNWFYRYVLRKYKPKWMPMPKGDYGVTNAITGKITISTGLTAAEEFATVLHEGVHRLFIPVGGTFSPLRAWLQNRLRIRHGFFEYVWEALAESFATGSLRAGLKFPIEEGYVTVGRAVTGGVAYLGFFAGMTYLGYLLSPFREPAAEPPANPRDPSQPAPATP